jgi:multifunctional beta-oxidation protein
VLSTETRDDTGTLVCETRWDIIYRLDGGFGGEGPPKSPKVRPPERDADFRVEEKTSEEQALLYRLNGDRGNSRRVQSSADGRLIVSM